MSPRSTCRTYLPRSIRPSALSLIVVMGLVPACRSKDDGGAATASKRVELSREKPKLVVLLVVDQMASWMFERDRKHLTGGFKRLLDNGVLFPRTELPYANSFTAPGHATIGTGAPPATTGILANSWYRRDEKRKVSAVADPATRVLSMPSTTTERHASSKNLLVNGIADSHRTATNGIGKSIALALKDRAATIMLGKKPTGVYWYDESQQILTTTMDFHPSLPKWLIDFNLNTPPSKWFGRVWEPSDAAQLAKVTGIEDSGIGEAESAGFGKAFPHSLKDHPTPGRAIRLTPMGTEYLFEAAKAIIAAEQLGQDDVPDVLGISVSTHDYASHYWGQESWERLDLILRLDQTLGEFLDHLDATVGKGNYSVVVTSDHGGTPMVERTAQTRPARRITKQAVAQIANAAAANVLGEGQWVASCSAATVFVTEAFNAAETATKEEALTTIVAALTATDGVGYVALVRDIVGNCDSRKGVARLACASVRKDLSGEIFVAPSHGSMLVGAGYTAGTAHGSPSDEDRHVPVIVSTPGGRRGVATEPATLTQIAPTVTQLLGVPKPDAAKTSALKY